MATPLFTIEKGALGMRVVVNSLPGIDVVKLVQELLPRASIIESEIQTQVNRLPMNGDWLREGFRISDQLQKDHRNNAEIFIAVTPLGVSVASGFTSALHLLTGAYFVVIHEAKDGNTSVGMSPGFAMIPERAEAVRRRKADWPDVDLSHFPISHNWLVKMAIQMALSTDVLYYGFAPQQLQLLPNDLELIAPSSSLGAGIIPFDVGTLNNEKGKAFRQAANIFQRIRGVQFELEFEATDPDAPSQPTSNDVIGIAGFDRILEMQERAQQQSDQRRGVWRVGIQSGIDEIPVGIPEKKLERTLVVLCNPNGVLHHAWAPSFEFDPKLVDEVLRHNHVEATSVGKLITERTGNKDYVNQVAPGLTRQGLTVVAILLALLTMPAMRQR